MTTTTRTVEISRGVEALRTIVLTFLEENLPNYIDVARMQWGEDEYTLPYPKRYDAYDPTLVGNDEFPMVGMFTPNKRGGPRTNIHTSAGMHHTVRYSGRLWVSARTPLLANGKWLQDPHERVACMKVRDDLIQCIEKLLLEWPSCGTHGLLYMEEADPPYSIDFLEPMMPNTQSKRWTASAMLSADFVVHETAYAQIIGSADRIVVDTRPFTPIRVQVGQAVETDTAQVIEG